jgi:hypothetical protein
MHWSWAAYRDCPLYVRRVFWDLLQARRQAEADHADRAEWRARNAR